MDQRPSVATRKYRNVLKGVFHSEELMGNTVAGSGRASSSTQFFHRHTPDLEHVSVMRLPPVIAALLRWRLESELLGEPIGVHVEPLVEEDYRVFTVKIDLSEDDENYIAAVKTMDNFDIGAVNRTEVPSPSTTSLVDGKSDLPSRALRDRQKVMKGVLLELPCKIEVYKFLPNDLEDGFKAADIGQMLYVWDPAEGDFDLDSVRPRLNDPHLKHTAWWEYRSGLTPPTYRIRDRKFRPDCAFERKEVAAAESEMADLMRADVREFVEVQPATLVDCQRHQMALAQVLPASEALALVFESDRKGAVVNVIGPNDSIFDLDMASDLSDALFEEFADMEDEPSGLEPMPVSEPPMQGGRKLLGSNDVTSLLDEELLLMEAQDDQQEGGDASIDLHDIF